MRRSFDLSHSLTAATRTHDFVLPPLPNSMFTRDSSCWIYGGVSLNPMYCPARQLEVVNVGDIYKYHPMFEDAHFEFWYPARGPIGPLRSGGLRAGVAGGRRRDAHRQRHGAGGHRASAPPPAWSSGWPASLFATGAADRIIACRMTKDRAHMHLDTVFTFLDRDAVTRLPARW